MSKNTEFRNNELNHYSDKRSDEVLISEEVLINDKALSEQSVIEERYGIDPDTNMIAGVPVRHPNRHEADNGGKRGASRSSGKSQPVPVGSSEHETGARPGPGDDAESGFTPVTEAGLYYYLLVISKKQSKLFKGTGQGLTFIDVPGMPFGFVDKRARLRGSFNEETDLLIVHASDTPGDVDLIDLTISKTRAAGGEVFMLDAKEMPVNRMMASIMRYK